MKPPSESLLNRTVQVTDPDHDYYGLYCRVVAANDDQLELRGIGGHAGILTTARVEQVEPVVILARR